MIKHDILAFAAHPDDVELACSGTIISHIQQGYQVAIVDLTAGELGTRGNKEIRAQESLLASQILGVKHRVNLGLEDGFFEADKNTLLKVIEQIRHFKPDIILCNALHDRHPDHARAGALVARAAFLSGLHKIKTTYQNNTQQAWRPQSIYHYIQDRWINPDFLIDISPYFEQRMKSVMAYASQFYNPQSIEPDTPISSQHFLQQLEGRMMQWGRLINVKYAEGFTAERPVGINNLKQLL
jgi:bacillithiol biosynthesis deacetylase BshB1